MAGDSEQSNCAENVGGWAAVGLYGARSHGGASFCIGFCALALTICAVSLDGVDGYLARRLRMASVIGAQLDILGDRVIENLFFIYFAVRRANFSLGSGDFFVRGVLTDFLRGIAASVDLLMEAHGAGEFQRNWMLVERWSARIVASRVEPRSVCGAEVCLLLRVGSGMDCAACESSFAPSRWGGAIHIAVSGIVFATMAFCVLRALPVFWEGLRDFRTAERVKNAPSVRVSQARLRPRGVSARRGGRHECDWESARPNCGGV